MGPNPIYHLRLFLPCLEVCWSSFLPVRTRVEKDAFSIWLPPYWVSHPHGSESHRRTSRFQFENNHSSAETKLRYECLGEHHVLMQCIWCRYKVPAFWSQEMTNARRVVMGTYGCHLFAYCISGVIPSTDRGCGKTRIFQDVSIE